MKRADSSHYARIRRGLTVVELMLGLVITAIVALAVGSMLVTVSEAAVSSRDTRSALVRGNLAQVRLRAYFEPALNVLAYDPARGVALWLHDYTPGETVNLLELRVLWHDAAAGTIAVERVHFPDTWTPTMKEAANVAIPADADFFAEMLAQRQAGMTRLDTLVETVTSFDVAHDAASLGQAQHVRVSLTVTSEAGESSPIYVAVGLANHTIPTF